MACSHRYFYDHKQPQCQNIVILLFFLPISVVFPIIEHIEKYQKHCKIAQYLLYIPAYMSHWPNAGLLLGQVVDGGPTVNQRWANITCLLGTTLVIAGPIIEWLSGKVIQVRISYFYVEAFKVEID